MGNKKIFKMPLDEDLSKSLLGNPSQIDGRTIWERLTDSIEELSCSIVEANESLQNSPVMPIVASSAARTANKRGNPSVRVDPDERCPTQVVRLVLASQRAEADHSSTVSY